MAVHYFLFALSICSSLQRTDYEWQVIAPRLEVRMRAITQLSLGGGHPSPIRGVTWPSEGDDVMNEVGWQHKVRLAALSLRARVDRVHAQARRQALGKEARLTWMISGSDRKVTILRKDMIDEWVVRYEGATLSPIWKNYEEFLQCMCTCMGD